MAGAPTLAAGQDYVLFLWTSKSGLTQVIGLSQGLFNVITNSQGQSIVSRGAATAHDARFLRAICHRFQSPDAAGAAGRHDSGCARGRPGNDRSEAAGSPRRRWWRLAFCSRILARRITTTPTSTARASPYIPIVARFDLNTLTNNTRPLLRLERGPVHDVSRRHIGSHCQPDTARRPSVWNNVSTSSIRLAYGGFYNPGTTESAPGIQIEFSDDIPPGLLAFSIPTVVGRICQRPQRHLYSDLSFAYAAAERLQQFHLFRGPSYSEHVFRNAGA